MDTAHTTLSDLGAVALSHRDKVDEVRRRIGITHGYYDAWIYGFLENKRYNVDETVAKLYRRFAFERDELATHEVTEWMHGNLRKGIIQVIGNDKQGRVVLYVTSCRDKPTAARRDESRRTFDMFVSYATRLRRDGMRCQLVMLINQDKASMWSNVDMTFQADIALRVAKYYPGAIDKMYICNMGRALAAFAKPIFSRLPAIVSDRIQIITDADLKAGALLELMDADVLPDTLGGRNACDDAAHWDSFAQCVEDYYANMAWAVTERGKTVKEWELECLGMTDVTAQTHDGGGGSRVNSIVLDDAAVGATTTMTALGARVDALPAAAAAARLTEQTLSRLASVVPSRRASAVRAAAVVAAAAGSNRSTSSGSIVVGGGGDAVQQTGQYVAVGDGMSSTSAVRHVAATPSAWPPSLSLSVTPGALQTCLSDNDDDDDMTTTAAQAPSLRLLHDDQQQQQQQQQQQRAAAAAASSVVLSGDGDAAWADIMSVLPPAVALFFLEELLQWRLVVEQQESVARYALYDRSVADRAQRSHNQLRGLHVRDVRWYAMVPLPLRELYRLVLLGVTFISVVYFAAALVFFAVFAADVTVTVFFGFHVKPSHFFPLNCVLVNVMLQGLALCSRASDILVAVCRGRVVPMFERLGSYHGTMVEVVLFFMLVAVQFVVFCVYAAHGGPLRGLQVAFATGWISAAVLVAISHVFFFTGVFVGRARENRWATLPFFLALGVGSSSSGGSSSSSSHGVGAAAAAAVVASSSGDAVMTTMMTGGGGGVRHCFPRLRHRTLASSLSPAQQQQQQQQRPSHLSSHDHPYHASDTHAHAHTDDLLLYPHHHHHHYHEHDDGHVHRGDRHGVRVSQRWWSSSPSHDVTVRMSSSLICGVPVTVSMLLGIGFLLSRDVALFACTLTVSLLAAFCVNYYSDAVSNSLSGALMRMTLWMMTVVWLYITFTFGFRGYDAAWLTSVVVAGVLHGVFVLLSFCCLLRPHNSWLLRVSFLLVLLYLVACWVTLFPLLHYRLGLLCLAFMLHNLLSIVLARRKLTNMTAVFLVSSAVLLLAMACVLLGWYGTVLQYIAPHSLPSLTPTWSAGAGATTARAAATMTTPMTATATALVADTSLAAYHHYPVCALRLGGDASLTIVDVALLTEVVMAYSADVRRTDLTRWFAAERGVVDDGVAAHFDSDDISWELHRFRTATATNTTFFVLNNRYAKSSIVSIVAWADAIALSPLSIFLPAEWAAQIVYVMSFMTRLIDYEWRSLVPRLAQYLEEQRRHLDTDIVVTSFGVTGGIASAAAAQSHTQAIVFAAPGLLHVRRTFDIDADAYRRYVLAVGATQGVLDLVGGHDVTMKQRLRCYGSALHCLSQAFISDELLRECGDVYGRRHTTPA